MKYGLALKGGGQRGLITACVLAGIEKQLGKPMREIVSYVAGTSTGALLAGAICAGIPAAQMVDFYTNRTKEVFKPTGVLDDIELITRGYRYDIKNLMKLLESIFAGPVASWTMNDCPIGIMIPAVASNGHLWYFVRDTAKNSRMTGTVNLLEAMSASAAATTYFDAQRVAIPTLPSKGLNCFDGGVGGQANPTYECATEMFEYDVFQPLETGIVTFGTGFYPVDPVADTAPPKGLLGGIEFATSTLVETSEDFVDQVSASQWPGTIRKFDWQLPRDISMDDLSAIPDLLKIGQAAATATDWLKVFVL